MEYNLYDQYDWIFLGNNYEQLLSVLMNTMYLTLQYLELQTLMIYNLTINYGQGLVYVRVI